VGGTYEVEVHPEGASRVVEASLRGRLKREQRTGDAVVVGDRVVVARQEDGGHTIEAVASRTNELARRAPGRGRHRGAKVLVANVDQLVAVFAVADPQPRFRLVDRFLVLAESSGISALIVANKVDLIETDRPFGLYEEIGYPVLYTSAEEGTGVEELEARLCGRVSALAGPSGAGKSSLLNAVEPGLGLRTGAVSGATRKGGKGRHTTVSARLIPLECGGYVADTPGLRELGLWDVDADTLDHWFPEFAEALLDCRFAGSCSHIHEPACGVRDAVEAGRIPSQRYESYVALLSDDD
jgi:ribosome biogenesis GTPase